MIKRNKENPYISSPIRGTNQDPLLIRVLEAENPNFKAAVQSLRAQGTTLNLLRLQKTPFDLRNAMQGLTTANLDLPLIAAQALVDSGDISRKPEGMNTTDIMHMREEAKGFLRIEANTNPNDARVKTINTLLQNDSYAKRYSVRRLTADRTSGEEDEFKKMALIAGIAISLGFGSEILLPQAINHFGWEHNPDWIPGFIPNLNQVALGLGLAATGQADDIAGALLNAKTENGGRKSIRQIVKENPKVAIAVGLAMFTDIAILPRLFEFHSLPMEVVQGGVFALTATAGSLAAKWGNVERNNKNLRKLDSLGELPGRTGHKNTLTAAEKRFFGLSWKENQSHPYRNGLFWGLLGSSGLSLLAATTGQLEGHPWSPFIQGAIGPAESVTAIIGAAGLIDWNNDYGINKLRADNQLRRRLRDAKGTPLNLAQK